MFNEEESQYYGNEDDSMVENDRNVLYIEELYDNTNTNKFDMRCYVIYDETQDEYFVTGSRRLHMYETYGNFKFYCKSKTTLTEYLGFIMNSQQSKINYGLFNCVNLFNERDYVTFDTLENARINCAELAFYMGMSFKPKKIQTLLKILEQVRY
jgi:hypothetical protein